MCLVDFVVTNCVRKSIKFEEKMSTTRSSRCSLLSVNLDAMANDPLRELFEACKTGDIIKVKKLITPQTVNKLDLAGRKSTPLHFAAGELFFNYFFFLKL